LVCRLRRTAGARGWNTDIEGESRLPVVSGSGPRGARARLASLLKIGKNIGKK
jgi:hypothetical protein